MNKTSIILNQILLWSLIMSVFLLIIFIVFRIISREMQKRRIDFIAKKDPGLQSVCELLKEGIKEISIPPVMVIKISSDVFNTIVGFSDILCEKRIIGYRYYKIKNPCIFYMNSRYKLEYKCEIEVIRYGKQIIRI